MSVTTKWTVISVIGWVIALMLSMIAAPLVWAQPRGVSESKAKLIYIVNILRYTAWPENSFAGPTAPFVFGVLGENVFGPDLEQLSKGTVQKRSIVVRICGSIDEAKQCHIVFVSSSERARFKEILEDLTSAGVMTVGDSDSFTRMGGAINLTIDKEKVKCEISRSATDRAKFKISSQFMELAKQVR